VERSPLSDSKWPLLMVAVKKQLTNVGLPWLNVSGGAIPPNVSPFSIYTKITTKRHDEWQRGRDAAQGIRGDVTSGKRCKYTDNQSAGTGERQACEPADSCSAKSGHDEKCELYGVQGEERSEQDAGRTGKYASQNPGHAPYPVTSASPPTTPPWSNGPPSPR
jgi:hypothetical protein